MSTVAARPVNDRLPALKLVQSSRKAARLAKLLLVLLALSVVAMIFAPWQQSARGSGKVVAYVPQERQQTVTSPVKGIAARLGEGLVEGAKVKRGDFIVEIEPNAANLVAQMQASLGDLDTKLATAQTKAEVYGQNVRAFAEARDAAVAAADQLIEAARAKYDAKQRLVPGYEAKALQAKQNYDRQQALFLEGVRSAKEVEKLRKDLDVAEAELQAARLDMAAAEDEWEAKQNERIQKEQEAQTKVDYARAMQQDALGQVATIQKERRAVEIKLSELERLKIYAPRDGTLFRVNIFERGQQLKEGDPLFTIVPDTSERAVELWVSGNDTPLVSPGDHVRLQFEGWPAVQFAGWPSVAVGTFGGQVMTIDPTDDGTGAFRILVQPDDQSDWPDERYLRQGVRANGWVMLSQVTLGYEIWRQLNGFPPSISGQPDKKYGDDAKKVKLPK
ncbi:MAG: HlyD family efflux transporter periplasmic adaptor subunit [Planctomycetota bacterium]|nr:MAG: HlyD family efflux transporter periplasmic adaptor subunit [Planctomycetota bacterium]REJ91402.1 MAG: HlyD family efflux transporter periplasmic adaptor subunit [Planctomycetota bacterium]REK18478.1 MAG: HlyD family efflux transporter periplasmic adaptor subunit [Planctomycetota bacterium]REK39461.1 MAG: HlyD family efflux transporter periplasmic adaptor subunit [Planctomycetota bacterium]